MEGDTKGWLEIDPATGEIKIKNKAVLDREMVEAFQFTVVAFEKGDEQTYVYFGYFFDPHTASLSPG